MKRYNTIINHNTFAIKNIIIWFGFKVHQKIESKMQKLFWIDLDQKGKTDNLYQI